MTDNPKTNILVIDDDVKLLDQIRTYLERQGYDVDTATEGLSALKRFDASPPDVVVLDIVFPDMQTSTKRSLDGIDVLRSLRDLSNVPILMLSATNVSAVKVMALTIGADDYIPKPFDLQELGARIEAVLRRTHDEKVQDKVLTHPRLKMDPGERRVWKDGNIVELTAVEFDMLYTLARRPDHVFTRDKLLELAWKDPNCSVSKVIDVHIGHIRRKIEDDPADPVFIVTVRGIGYRFESEPA